MQMTLSTEAIKLIYEMPKVSMSGLQCNQFDYFLASWEYFVPLLRECQIENLILISFFLHSIFKDLMLLEIKTRPSDNHK